MSDDLIKRLKALEAFLRGEEPLRGANFDEPNPALHKGMFWWRNYLGPIDEAATALAEAQAAIARLAAALRDIDAMGPDTADMYPIAYEMATVARTALSPGKAERLGGRNER
jgi:hypothetical protein